ncbi:hypothetical protein HMPREF1872_00257 [Amygdalobacter nucleatus]|uniref:Uncharacterized protein n=1 Tax=Amygdalobacter nucleatus TaxID=3029274 RepID=A0A133YHA4_9FIRM|nr:hypothetical protein HMPREF1872_00257 [Amygdalobacter nucleatus]
MLNCHENIQTVLSLLFGKAYVYQWLLFHGILRDVRRQFAYIRLFVV